MRRRRAGARGSLRPRGQRLPSAPPQCWRQVILHLGLHQQLLKDLRHVHVVFSRCLDEAVLPVDGDDGFCCVEFYLLDKTKLRSIAIEGFEYNYYIFDYKTLFMVPFWHLSKYLILQEPYLCQIPSLSVQWCTQNKTSRQTLFRIYKLVYGLNGFMA